MFSASILGRSDILQAGFHIQPNCLLGSLLAVNPFFAFSLPVCCLSRIVLYREPLVQSISSIKFESTLNTSCRTSGYESIRRSPTSPPETFLRMYGSGEDACPKGQLGPNTRACLDQLGTLFRAENQKLPIESSLPRILLTLLRLHRRITRHHPPHAPSPLTIGASRRTIIHYLHAKQMQNETTCTPLTLILTARLPLPDETAVGITRPFGHQT